MNFLDVPVLTDRHGRLRKLSCQNAAILFIGYDRIFLIASASFSYQYGARHGKKDLRNWVNAYGEISYVPRARDNHTFSASFVLLSNHDAYVESCVLRNVKNGETPTICNVLIAGTLRLFHNAYAMLTDPW